MRITFHGAARSVTGSRHLIETNGKRILLDCGLVQGRRDEADRQNREFQFDPAGVDAVILSHAHIDHSGAVPALVRRGYDGAIHATLATADLASCMLPDSAHLQERDAEFANKRMARRGDRGPRREPVYTLADATRALAHFRGHAYYEPFEVLPGVRATFYDAGHILGSASISLEFAEGGLQRSIVFTGDLGRPHLPIIREPDRPPAPDVLLLESTYGDRDHEPMADASERLAEIINTICARKGKLIIPAFAVGRVQDLVYELVRLSNDHRFPDCPIYVDSPMAVNATEIFRRHPECYNDEIRQMLRDHEDPFGLSRMRYVRTVEESMALNTAPGPFLVLSASGMMEGGRVLHHLRNSLGDPRNGILIVGFQAENTLGRRILRGDPVVNVFGEPHEVRAEVFVMNAFSAHADRREILEWFRKDPDPPRDIFVVHGEEEQSLALARHLEDESSARVHVPHLHETWSGGSAEVGESAGTRAARGHAKTRSKGSKGGGSPKRHAPGELGSPKRHAPGEPRKRKGRIARG